MLSDPDVGNRFTRIIFETNASVDLDFTFLAAIQRWQSNGGHWVWSNSPKLSCSGETRESSIRPSVLLVQQKMGQMDCDCREYSIRDWYLKFVTDGTDLEEIRGVIKEYNSNGVKIAPSQVFLMPMACTDVQQNDISREVAEVCISSGYTFFFRLQNAVFGNVVGT
jgi:hypothetical protein